MFDKFIYNLLDSIVNLCNNIKTKLQNRKLSKECSEDWVKGYKNWKQKQIKE